MSALTNPVAKPAQAPPHPVAPDLQPRRPKRHFGAIWLLLAVLAGGAWAAYQYWWKPAQAAKTAPVATFRTAKVVVGPFQQTLRLSGQTGARQYANITAPRMRGFESRSQMELLSLVKNGTWVKTGDVLAQIDPGYLQDHIDDIQATILQADKDVEKRKVEHEVEWENFLQTVRLTKAQLDKARLDYSAAEVRTDVERELLKLALEEAEAQHKQNEAAGPYRKIIQAAEIKILGFTRERHVRHVNRHLTDLKNYTIKAPMEGLVVLQSIYRGGGESQQIQQGDQVGSGQQLMKIVNPSSMQVEASVSQADVAHLRIGQKATIGIDAFPDLKLEGEIYSIGALAVGGFRQNYYIRSVPIRLTIKGSDPRIIPDLSAYADVQIRSIEKATLVPLGALRREGSATYVHVKQGDRFVKRRIEIGEANNLYAVALSGLQGGEELRLD